MPKDKYFNNSCVKHTRQRVWVRVILLRPPGWTFAGEAGIGYQVRSLLQTASTSPHQILGAKWNTRHELLRFTDFIN
jgi:hypothetical protein